MSFKRIVFWSHLCVAVAASLMILSLCVTGFAIAYERQFVAMAEARHDAKPAAGPVLSADALAGIAAGFAGVHDVALVFRNKPGAAVKVDMERFGQYFLDPYSGEVRARGRTRTERLFGLLTRLHRNLSPSGAASRTTTAALDLANLGFVFLAVSGAYLWWPKSWRWRIVSKSLLFRRALPSSKARDYNWHHVFGFWALIPLFLIATSGVVISYPWAHRLVYQVYGEPVPDLRFRPRQDPEPPEVPAAYLGPGVTLQAMLEKSKEIEPDWNRITIPLPRSAEEETVEIRVDSGNGVQPGLQTTAIFDRADGRLAQALPANYAVSPGRRARVFLGYLHTGEAFGLPGQTIAALACLSGAFLVYTGLALAYRRLIQPFFRRRRMNS